MSKVPQPTATTEEEESVEISAEHAARIADLERSMGDVDPVTGEIVKAQRQPYSEEELRNLNSLESIKALLGDTQVTQAADLGSGFALLDTEGKRRLVGVPVLFLFWTFNKGTQGSAEFVSAHVVQTDNLGNVVGKFIINDGSTGIYQQLKDFTARTGQSKGLYAARGLRASDYTFTNDAGQDQDATTFYIDTSAPA